MGAFRIYSLKEKKNIEQYLNKLSDAFLERGEGVENHEKECYPGVFPLTENGSFICLLIPSNLVNLSILHKISSIYFIFCVSGTIHTGCILSFVNNLQT